MTKMEAITRVLEEGRKNYESGKSFSINGILFANYSRKAHMEFNYKNNETIYSILVISDGTPVSCVMARDITKINVSYENMILTDHSRNILYGRVNGEEIDIEYGKEVN